MRFFTRLVSLILSMCLFAALIQPTTAGGWGVTTVEAMPQVIIAGEKAAIRLAIRQHGVHLMAGLQPTLSFAKGVDRLAVTARPISTDTKDIGYYVAEVVFPSAGEWQWVMTSFPMQHMISLKVISTSQRQQALRQARLAVATPMGQVALGKDLFMSKGCFVCHAHAAIAKSGEFRDAYPLGHAPDLTQHGLSETYLQMWLKNPQSLKPKTQMPNLGLNEAEVRALAAFLTAK